MILGTTDYRDILKREMETRFRRNPSYSLRSFARDLGIAPSRLSDALTGRAGFSKEVALRISKRLGFSTSERDYFCTLVEKNHARSKGQRLAAEEKLKSLEEKFNADSYQQVQVDAFRVISDWHHFAILELTALDDFQSDFDWIAARLGISRFETEQAIERLQRLDLLEINAGAIRATDSRTATTSGISSESIRKFHAQILQKAADALHFQTVEERDFSANLFAIDRARIPAAKEKLRRFRRKFTKEFSSDGNPVQKKESVYCLSVQLFDLTPNSKKEEK